MKNKLQTLLKHKLQWLLLLAALLGVSQGVWGYYPNSIFYVESDDNDAYKLHLWKNNGSACKDWGSSDELMTSMGWINNKYYFSYDCSGCTFDRFKVYNDNWNGTSDQDAPEDGRNIYDIQTGKLGYYYPDEMPNYLLKAILEDGKTMCYVGVISSWGAKTMYLYNTNSTSDEYLALPANATFEKNGISCNYSAALTSSKRYWMSQGGWTGKQLPENPIQGKAYIIGNNDGLCAGGSGDHICSIDGPTYSKAYFGSDVSATSLSIPSGTTSVTLTSTCSGTTSAIGTALKYHYYLKNGSGDYTLIGTKNVNATSALELTYNTSSLTAGTYYIYPLLVDATNATVAVRPSSGSVLTLTVTSCTQPTYDMFSIRDNSYTYDGAAHSATVTSNTEGYSPTITWGHGANSSSTTPNKTTAGTYGTYVLTASASGDYCAVTSAISTSVGNLIIEKEDQAALSISTTPTTTCMGNTFTLETSGGTDSGAVTYEIVSGGSGSGSIVGTTLSASEAGTINVKATKAATTNYNAATAEQTFTFNANPSTPSITSYDEYVCSGAAPTFTFSSTSGLTYQMYVGGSTSGDDITGDGSSQTLTAGTITSATTFNLRATNSTTGCYSSSSGATVGITPDMALTSITLSPSTICAGGESIVTANGLVLGGGSVTYSSSAPAKATVAKVSDSEATVTGVAVGSSTITATLSGGCGSNVSQTATITVSAGPETYTLSAAGGTTICSAGGKLRLSGSESGFSYQLYKNGSAYGSPVAGTGSAIEFDVFESGDYVCRAYLTSSPSCYTVMTGEVTLHISLTPTLIPATPTVTSYTPVTITSINTDILTWEISGEGNTAYLYDKTSNTVKVKASAAGSPYTITATTSGGCSQTATLTVNADVEVCD